MRRVFRAALYLALLSLFGCSDSELATERSSIQRSPAVSSAHSVMEVVLTLEEGSEPDQVTLRHPGEEVHAGGPSALAVGPAGVIAVADTLAGRVIRVRPGGGSLAPVSMYGVVDVAFDSDGLLYGFSRTSSRVSTFDEDGQEIETIDIPRTMRWVTGFCAMPGGRVGLHTAYQESVPLDAQDLHLGLTEGVPGLGGERYRTLRRDGRASIEVFEGSSSTPRRHEVSVATQLGSLIFVGATEDGEVVVDVQDVVQSRPIDVDRTLRRYSPEGELRARAAVPRGTYVPLLVHELAPDGAIYSLMPTTSGVEILSWPALEGGAR